MPTARARSSLLGSIQGVVVDDRGGPLAGAMVSALGVTSAMTTTDARGRFLLQPLPSGPVRPPREPRRLRLDAA